jgi:hypothetical protein
LTQQERHDGQGNHSRCRIPSSASKLNDATRLAKEGAEERHTGVMQKMEASTNVEAIPDSLF